MHLEEILLKNIWMPADAGLNVEGINAEVAARQWEFQIFSKGAKAAVIRYGLPLLSWKE
jgi:glutamine synthetase